jgi:uncharacterized protein (DUF58 family)
MEREPECYNAFRIFNTVMGVLASGIFLMGFIGILAYCVEPVTSISPTLCILLMVSGLGLLTAAVAGGLFLNLVKNVYLTTLQNELVLRQLAEINPKEQARREARFQPRNLKLPNAIKLRPASSSRR